MAHLMSLIPDIMFQSDYAGGNIGTAYLSYVIRQESATNGAATS